MLCMTDLLPRARAMLAHSAAAVEAVSGLLDERLTEAVQLIAGLDSILIVTGLGKSGLVAQKAAATLSSTGTQTAFVHPVEALHGDLGIVRPGSAMLALSKSGGNEETIEFARQFRLVTQGKVISVTEPGSRLASVADIPLSIPILAEIDEFNLAPTTSTLTTMAVCDMLAILVQQEKGLTDHDFARFHPSGTLGRRLLLEVKDLMIQGDALPIVPRRHRLCGPRLRNLLQGHRHGHHRRRRRRPCRRGDRRRHSPPLAARRRRGEPYPPPNASTAADAAPKATPRPTSTAPPPPTPKPSTASAKCAKAASRNW